ncbi:hypothetical protein ACQEVZ_02020 [Dactylosporangium sp. CA-152071]|uniref:hypothetical protein n=1 Tax=Dactylosporangium sp. CA-152071 TaxID=3239933 RepID=UPI003D943D9F
MQLQAETRGTQGRSILLLRPPYLALTNVFASIRLLPMSDADDNVEILALRHQLAILQRQFDRRHRCFERRQDRCRLKQ